jgi:membrane protein
MKLFWITVVTFARALFGALTDFRKQGCFSLSASMAFFALLSFFPMVFLLLYGVSFFVSADRFGHEFLLNFFQGFMPGLGAELAEEVKRVAREQVVQWVVLAVFSWFAMLVFYEVDYAVNVVFGTARTRNALVSSLMSVALLVFVGVLMTASYVITQIMDVIVSYAPSMGGVDVVAVAANRLLLTYALPFASILLAVTCIYRYLPQYRPTWHQAVAGGLVFTFLWELAKHLFSTYVQNLAVYGRMYGSLLVVVFFLLWVYYSAVLFLYGAAVVHRLQRASEQ